ncbi:MAG: DUF58 domain-containing protein [Betaproteobacteria bacterium]
MFKFLRRRKRAATAPASATPAAATAAAGTAQGAAPRKRVDPDLLLRRLEWTVIRRLDGMLQGDYRNLLRGFGLDFADLREYQPHDDVRYIDWNVTARLQTPYVREFQEDREITAWFLLDLSGSVDFGSRGVKKRELSIELVSVLARLLTRYGNRVGAVIFRNGAFQVVPPRAGRRQVLHLLERMQRIDEQQSDGAETDLADLLKKAAQAIRRRSAIIIVSDFISTPGWGKALSLLARRHEVVAARLFDPMELALPNLGFVVLQDAETGEQLFVDTQDKGFRERFRVNAEQRETELRTALAHSGVDCLELATDDQLGEALLRFTTLRKRRSQLAAGGGAIHRQLAL